MAFNGFPIMHNPKYEPEISVAAPAPIKDIFIGVSVNFSIKKNATNNSEASEKEMMHFFINNSDLSVKATIISPKA